MLSDPKRSKNSNVRDAALRRHLKEVRRRLLWDVHCRAHNDVAAVVGEERALAVEVLAVGGHVRDVELREEALEESPADV